MDAQLMSNDSCSHCRMACKSPGLSASTQTLTHMQAVVRPWHDLS